MLKLEFVDSSRQPLWLVDKSLSIGRAEDNQLVLDDPAVSAQHARINCQADGFVLRDLDSESGTFVNGQRIRSHRVAHGDQLRFGGTLTRLVAPYSGDAHDQPWVLVASSSWLAGQEFTVRSKNGQSVIKLGRGKGCDVLLPGTHLSREHAELVSEGYRLRVKDLGSANGTFINDRRIEEAWAEAGDRLRFDVYNFVLVGPRNTAAGQEPTADEKNAAEDADELSDLTAEAPKHWDIPSTSPGNRTEPAPPPAVSLTPYLLAGGLLLAAVGVALYVFFA